MAKVVSHARWFLAPYCVGLKLRALRSQKRLTLARLAAETGLSTALLSKLETDRMVPTLTTLATICRVYGVGLGHFFSEPSKHTLSVTRGVARRGRGRGRETRSIVPLNPAVPNRRMNACIVDLASGLARESPETGNSALLVCVLDGRLNLDVGGMRESLDNGDCVYLETDLPVAWSAAGNTGCRILTVSPAGAEGQA